MLEGAKFFDILQYTVGPSQGITKDGRQFSCKATRQISSQGQPFHPWHTLLGNESAHIAAKCFIDGNDDN